MPPEENAPVHIEDFVPSLLTEPKKDAAPAPRDAQPPARAAAEATPEIDESDDLSPDDLIDDLKRALKAAEKAKGTAA